MIFNKPVLYSLPTAVSSVTMNHGIDLFSLYLLFDLLITGRNFEDLTNLQVICCHKGGDSEGHAWLYYKALNQTFSAQKYQGLPLNSRSNSMVKDKKIFSLVISKLMSAFSL